MRKKEVKELQNKTIEELQKKAEDLKNDIGQLQIDKGLGKVKNVNEAREKKKDVARIYTTITQKTKEASNKEKEVENG